VTGGTYNADGLTVADVLSTAVAAPAVAAAAPVTPAPAPSAPTAPTLPAAPAVQTVASAPPAADTAAVDPHHSPVPEMAQHFHHMWG
jgi:hypothetical protein